MRVLLVRPSNRTPVVIPNYPLGYLASALRTRGHEVTYIDCVKERWDTGTFKRWLARLDEKPEMVGYQAFSFDVGPVRRHMQDVRDVLPHAVQTVGGPFPTGEPDEIFSFFPDAEFAFASEAEEGLPMIADLVGDIAPEQRRAHLREGKLSLTHIPGLIWRNGDVAACNPVRVVADLDAIPMPAWDLIDPASYPHQAHGTFTRQIPSAATIATRGCPYPCTFCAAGINSGKPVRWRSVENLMDEIQHLHFQYGIKELHFEDDNFTLKRERVLEFCEALSRLDLGITWALPNGLRLDKLDKEVLQAMERAGCYAFAVGIESGNQRVLNAMAKHLTLEQIETQLHLIRETTKIDVTGFFILGFPGETRAEMNDTLRFAQRLPIVKANFGNYMPHPGTSEYSRLKAAGKLDGIRWEEMFEYSVPYAPEGISKDELRKLLRRAFFRFYARPKVVWSFIRQIHSFGQVQALGQRFFYVAGLGRRKEQPVLTPQLTAAREAQPVH
jgi:anaerobic magnesium-protoporphyrin IX monomethyl ester cyclase